MSVPLAGAFQPTGPLLPSRQETSYPNLFLAGDWVKGLDHGANGLSQVGGRSGGALPLVECRLAGGAVRRTAEVARPPPCLPSHLRRESPHWRRSARG